MPARQPGSGCVLIQKGSNALFDFNLDPATYDATRQSIADAAKARVADDQAQIVALQADRTIDADSKQQQIDKLHNDQLNAASTFELCSKNPGELKAQGILDGIVDPNSNFFAEARSLRRGADLMASNLLTEHNSGVAGPATKLWIATEQQSSKAAQLSVAYFLGVNGTDTAAQAQSIIDHAVAMLNGSFGDKSMLMPGGWSNGQNTADKGILVLQVLAYASPVLPADDRAILRQEVVNSGLFATALNFINQGNAVQDATNKILGPGVAGGNAVAFAIFGVPALAGAAVDGSSALASCVTNIACRAYLYIEGTAALESLANPGAVPVITGLAGAAGYTAKLTGAADLAENLASDFLNLELRANALAGGASP